MAWFPFKLESASLWFWLSGQHAPPRLWPERCPPQQVSRGNKASYLILKVKSQREQTDLPCASMQQLFWPRKREIRHGFH